MTRYLLNIWQPDGPPPDDLDLDAIMSDVRELNVEMQRAGVWVFAAGLHPASTATVLHADRADQAELLVTDGPYAEGKEHIGGFTVIDVPDLDAAMHWAGKLARVLSGLSIEVRPTFDT
jgi:hypothetical protein